MTDAIQRVFAVFRAKYTNALVDVVLEQPFEDRLVGRVIEVLSVEECVVIPPLLTDAHQIHGSIAIDSELVVADNDPIGLLIPDRSGQPLEHRS